MNEWMNAWVFLPSSIALRPNILHCMKRNKMRESYCNRDYFDCLFTPGLCLLLWTTYLIGQQCLCTQRWLFLFCKFQSYLFWVYLLRRWWSFIYKACQGYCWPLHQVHLILWPRWPWDGTLWTQNFCLRCYDVHLEAEGVDTRGCWYLKKNWKN